MSSPRSRERLLAPRIPVGGVVFALLQGGTGLALCQPRRFAARRKAAAPAAAAGDRAARPARAVLMPRDAEGWRPCTRTLEVMRYVGDGRTLAKGRDRALGAAHDQTVGGRWLPGSSPPSGRTTRRSSGASGSDLEQRHVGPTTRAQPSGPTEVEVGYTLGRDFSGLGYATESAGAVRRLALNGLGAERVIALIIHGEHGLSRAWRASSGSSTSATSGSGRATRQLFALDAQSRAWQSESRDLLEPHRRDRGRPREPRRRRPVFPRTTRRRCASALGGPMPEEPPGPPTRVVAELAEAAEPGVVATGSGRYFELRDRRRRSRGPGGRLARLPSNT